MAARATQPPIVAPTIAPVEVLLEDEAAALGVELLAPVPLSAETFDDDRRLDPSPEVSAALSEDDADDVGQPTPVGDVSAHPSMG